MTQNEKNEIITLYTAGVGYKKIASDTGISVNTVKSFCRKYLTEEKENTCKFCGAELTFVKGKKKKKFCSDSCRFAWWSKHPECRKTVHGYEHTCPNCLKKFTSNRECTVFCSKNCFYAAKRKAVKVNG